MTRADIEFVKGPVTLPAQGSPLASTLAAYTQQSGCAAKVDIRQMLRDLSWDGNTYKEVQLRPTRLIHLAVGPATGLRLIRIASPRRCRVIDAGDASRLLRLVRDNNLASGFWSYFAVEMATGRWV